MQRVPVRSGACPSQHVSTTLSRISVWNTLTCNHSAAWTRLGEVLLLYFGNGCSDVSDIWHHIPQDFNLTNQHKNIVIPHSYVKFKTIFNIFNPSNSRGLLPPKRFIPLRCFHWSDFWIGLTRWQNKTVKWSRYRPGVAQRVGRSIALLFHNRGTRRGWVVSSTPRPHFTPGKDPVSILQVAGWAPGPGGKSRSHRDSIPGRPARSQSLYRLSYPAHINKMIWMRKQRKFL